MIPGIANLVFLYATFRIFASLTPEAKRTSTGWWIFALCILMAMFLQTCAINLTGVE